MPLEDVLMQRLRDLEGKQVLEIIARLSPVSLYPTEQHGRSLKRTCSSVIGEAKV
jgi:hypothetical protein